MQELGELPLDSQPYDEKFGQGLGSTGDAAQVHTVSTTLTFSAHCDSVVIQ
jgi:hypothetical protein